MRFLVYSLLVSVVAFAGESPENKATIYSPVGKRDPFRPPNLNTFSRDVMGLSPLEKFPVEQMALKAILRGIGKPRAMFEDPDGKTHIVSEGDIIGREKATISRVLNNEVIVTERTFNYLGVESLYEKVLSLPTEDQAVKGEVVPGGASGVPRKVGGTSK